MGQVAVPEGIVVADLVVLAALGVGIIAARDAMDRGPAVEIALVALAVLVPMAVDAPVALVAQDKVAGLARVEIVAVAVIAEAMTVARAAMIAPPVPKRPQWCPRR